MSGVNRNKGNTVQGNIRLLHIGGSCWPDPLQTMSCRIFSLLQIAIVNRRFELMVQGKACKLKTATISIDEEPGKMGG